MSKTDETPLALCTVDQIVDELNRRFDHVIVCVDTAENGSNVNRTFHHGSLAACTGLADLCYRRLIKRLDGPSDYITTDGEWDEDQDDDE